MPQAWGRVNDEIEKYASVCVPCRWLWSRWAAQHGNSCRLWQVMPLRRAYRPCRLTGGGGRSATITSTISESRRATHPEGEINGGTFLFSDRVSSRD
jgi:hypothetical protein